MSGTYAEMLKNLMKSRDNAQKRELSISDLAHLIGISREHIRKMVNGEPVASADVNARLADKLGFDAEEGWKLIQREKAVRRYGIDTFFPGQPMYYGFVDETPEAGKMAGSPASKRGLNDWEITGIELDLIEATNRLRQFEADLGGVVRLLSSLAGRFQVTQPDLQGGVAERQRRRRGPVTAETRAKIASAQRRRWANTRTTGAPGERQPTQQAPQTPTVTATPVKDHTE